MSIGRLQTEADLKRFGDQFWAGPRRGGGPITADKIAVEQLSDINSNLGTIVAGSVTGALIRTAESGSRVEMDSAGLRGIDTGGDTKIQFDVSTGVLSVEGIVVSQAGSEIHGSHISFESVTADQIAAGAITAGHIDVDSLSAITADLGEVTAGTLTGTMIRTAETGARVEIDSQGIRAYNASDEQKFSFDATTGILAVKAVISAETGSTIDASHIAGQLTREQVDFGQLLHGEGPPDDELGSVGDFYIDTLNKKLYGPKE